MSDLPSIIRIDAKFQQKYYNDLIVIAKNKFDAVQKNKVSVCCEPLTLKDFAFTKNSYESADSPVAFKLTDVDGRTYKINDQSFLMRLHKLFVLRDNDCNDIIDNEFINSDIYIDTQTQEIEFTPDLQREAELRYNKSTFLINTYIEQPAHSQMITGTGFIIDRKFENNEYHYTLVTPWANIYGRTLALSHIELRSLDQSTEILSGVKIKYQDYVSQLVFLEFTSEQDLGVLPFLNQTDYLPRPGAPIYELNYSAAKVNRLSLIKPVNLYRTENFYPFELWRIETPTDLSTDTWGAPILLTDMSLLGLCMYNDPEHKNFQMILPIETVQQIYQRLVASQDPKNSGKTVDSALALAYSHFGLDLVAMAPDDLRRQLLSANYQSQGVMIGRVDINSKLEAGDIILEIDGQPIQNIFDTSDLAQLYGFLSRKIQDYKPVGTSFKIFRRDGNQSSVLTVQVVPELKQVYNNEIATTPFGFRVITFNESFRTIMPKAKTEFINSAQTGVFIDNVARNPADGSPQDLIVPGLYHGDIVSEINGTPISSADEFIHHLNVALQTQAPIVLKTHHVFGSLAPNINDSEWVYLSGFKK